MIVCSLVYLSYNTKNIEKYEVETLKLHI